MIYLHIHPKRKYRDNNFFKNINWEMKNYIVWNIIKRFDKVYANGVSRGVPMVSNV